MLQRRKERMQTILVKNLTKTYGNKTVVNNLNISVSSGEIFGLLGTNGAGKTTTIECILGTKKADTGYISILGKNPKKQRKELFEMVGVQFQESSYQDKILVSELCEITQSLYQKPKDYQGLLKQFGIIDKMNNQISELSGGQRQKLFIVLALIPNPKVVFLDELTTGLDPKSRRDVWRSLITLKEQGLTVMLTSHFMDEVEALCDHIMIMSAGNIIFTGSVQKAIENSPYDKFEDAYLWYVGEEENNENI
jgi:ABC-2 type transport system ATP-binding protein